MFTRVTLRLASPTRRQQPRRVQQNKRRSRLVRQRIHAPRQHVDQDFSRVSIHGRRRAERSLPSVPAVGIRRFYVFCWRTAVQSDGRGGAASHDSVGKVAEEVGLARTVRAGNGNNSDLQGTPGPREKVGQARDKLIGSLSTDPQGGEVGKHAYCIVLYRPFHVTKRKQIKPQRATVRVHGHIPHNKS